MIFIKGVIKNRTQKMLGKFYRVIYQVIDGVDVYVVVHIVTDLALAYQKDEIVEIPVSVSIYGKKVEYTVERIANHLDDGDDF